MDPFKFIKDNDPTEWEVEVTLIDDENFNDWTCKFKVNFSGEKSAEKHQLQLLTIETI